MPGVGYCHAGCSHLLQLLCVGQLLHQLLSFLHQCLECLVLHLHVLLLLRHLLTQRLLGSHGRLQLYAHKTRAV